MSAVESGRTRPPTARPLLAAGLVAELHPLAGGTVGSSTLTSGQEQA